MAASRRGRVPRSDRVDVPPSITVRVMFARSASRCTVYEGEVLDLLQEREDVAALTAAEAVVVAPCRADLERRGLLVVERAQPLEIAAAGVAQCDVLPHDLLDATGVANPFPVRL